MKNIKPSLIPTREEFHQEYAGEITLEDFSTEKTSRRKIPYHTHKERNFKNLK
jgi:hypothetical protein